MVCRTYFLSKLRSAQYYGIILFALIIVYRQKLYAVNSGWSLTLLPASLFCTTKTLACCPIGYIGYAFCS